ncbi:YgjP-like metallopeptidase domain-containing protein [Actinocrispum wychmicini]|uniref:Uncharacterized protein DUF45 n=1 Tax=Actinocrispum wychmicini TaxID=1213861 RepID=A0A4R2JAR5_9PSEU|nr:YgjP-like metallopeptidase domain-containing protein [Actinocrispum wychmicini]TCO55884.1 uncharacterized protein DUF45 [Actinocrispum wychmicini]
MISADDYRAAVAGTDLPGHAVKEFVDGEDFDLLGHRYRLHLVDTPAAGIAALPMITLGSVLYARRQRPQQIRRAVIGLYCETGLAWVRRVGRPYELDGQIPGLTYAVRDLGRYRWGVYNGHKHTTTVHWAAFGLPLRLTEYVLVHEQAHAARGLAWQLRMDRWMPDWRQRQTELADVGRHAWLGDWNEGP